PLTPIVAIIGSLFVLISTMITDWKSCLISMLIGIAGLPIYYYMKKTHKKAER
ncbi:serine/threonine protein kinase, partial [Bacillus sp. JR_15]